MLRTRITLGLLAAIVLTILIIAGCDELITQTQEITTAGNPTADFTYSPDSGCVPLTVTFRDASSGPVARWFWRFGDGDTVTTDTGYVTHTYDSAGVFVLTLVVFDTLDGSDAEEKRPRALIVGQSMAGFSASPDSVCAGTEVDFVPTGYGGISSWRWQYGDGDSSIDTLGDSHPTHVYTAAGTHPVRLIIRGGCGVDTLFDTVEVSLCPAAGFRTEVLCGPLQVRFYDESVAPDSAHPVNSWYWTFGESKTSHQQDTTITFASAGAHEVSLTVSIADGGSSTYVDTVYAYGAVQPAFTATPVQSCRMPWRQFVVKFTDLTVGPVDSFIWWFDDGDTVWNDHEPAHAYIEPGIYRPELWVYRCGDLTKEYAEDEIIYCDSLNSPTFSVDPPDSGWDSTTFVFTDTSSGVIIDRVWEIHGPGWDTTVTNRTSFTKSFSLSGTYKVRLTISNLCGETIDSAMFRIVD